MTKFQLAGVCLLVSAACLSPRGAQAQQFILDTGTPTSGINNIMSNTNWYAAEFQATGGETITDLSAYLTSMTGNGDNFAFDIYTDGNGSFLPTRNANLGPLLELTAVGTYAGLGWSTTAVDWTVPSSGKYWLAIEGDTAGTHNLPTFDVEEETSTMTGTVPALAFAIDSGVQFKTSGAVPVGLEVTAVPVPEPASWGLVAAGTVLLSCVRGGRRRRARACHRG